MEDQVGDFLKQLAAKLELVLLIITRVLHIGYIGPAVFENKFAWCGPWTEMSLTPLFLKVQLLVRNYILLEMLCDCL